MATRLEDDYARLKLTQAREEVVVCGNRLSKEREDEIALCLFGKLNTNANLNIDAIMFALRNIWNSAKGLVIKEFDRNLFLFHCFPILMGALHLIKAHGLLNEHLLLLKELSSME